MRKLESHGRLNLIVFFCVLAPLFVALGAGFRAIRNISQIPESRLDSMRVEEVTSQARMLTESLWSATDSIRSRAFAIYQTQSQGHKIQSLPEGPLLFLTQLELKEDGKWNILETLRKPGFSPDATFEAGYLKALVESGNLLETQRRGVGMIAMPRVEGERKTPLVMTFPIGARGLLAALFYPMEGFPIFEKWRAHSEGGLLRAYLVGKDGTLLAHSISSYVGSKIDSSSLYKQSLQPLFLGERISGAGTYPAIDLLQTTLSYMRMGQMDLGVVVEKVLSSESVSLPWLELVAAGLLSLGVALLLAFTLSTWLLRQVPVSEQKNPKISTELSKAAASTAAWIQPQKQRGNGSSGRNILKDDLESTLPVIGGNSGKRKYDPSLNQ